MLDAKYASSLFNKPWTRNFLYLRLKREKDEVLNSIDDDQVDFNDQMLEAALANKLVHQKMIKAYSDAGLNFFSIHGFKLERNDKCHLLSQLEDDEISTKVTEELKLSCPSQGDSRRVQQLRSSLAQILVVLNQVMYIFLLFCFLALDTILKSLVVN